MAASELRYRNNFHLLNWHISKGMCSHCGTCEASCPLRLPRIVSEGKEPKISKECQNCGSCYSICPKTHLPITGLKKIIFNNKGDQDILLGNFCSLYSLSRKDLLAITRYAFEIGLIDCIVGTKAKDPFFTGDPEQLGELECFKKPNNVLQSFDPLLSAMREAVERGYEKIGVVGRPCVIHGVRKIQHLPKISQFEKKLSLTIGSFCFGSLSQESLNNLLKREFNFDLAETESILYAGDSEIIYLVKRKDGKTKILLGSLLIKYAKDSCLTCPDFSNELADISFGTTGNIDKYTVIFRSQIGEKLLIDAKEKDLIPDAKVLNLDKTKIYSDLLLELSRCGITLIAKVAQLTPIEQVRTASFFKKERSNYIVEKLAKKDLPRTGIY